MTRFGGHLHPDEPVGAPLAPAAPTCGPTTKGDSLPAHERDQALIKMIAEGDTRRLIDLLGNYHLYIRKLCWKFKAPELFEDLFQELCLRILQEIDTLDIRSSFAGWLFWQARTLLRKLRPVGSSVPSERHSLPHDDAGHLPETITYLYDCLDGLDDIQILLVCGHYLLGLRYGDIVKRIPDNVKKGPDKIKVNNAYQISHRALRALASCLQSKGVKM